MNKKVLITILITIILLIFSIILYPIIKNNNYQKKLLNNIYENTDLKDIKYLNKDNNYHDTITAFASDTAEWEFGN